MTEWKRMEEWEIFPLFLFGELMGYEFEFREVENGHS